MECECIYIQSCASPGFEQASLLVDAQRCFHSVFYHPHFMPSLIILDGWDGIMTFEWMDHEYTHFVVGPTPYSTLKSQLSLD